jgi:hypothetical protein
MDAYKKFTHKTPHLKGKQHQLDPNIDLKQLVYHAAVQYVDRDADGDVDVYDNPKKKTPDENPIGVDFGNLSKKLIAKQKGEIKHTKRGMAYEEVEEKRYCPLCDKRETRSECSYGEKAWDKVSVKDHEYSMARSELSTVMNAVKRLQKKMSKGEGNVEAWVQSKITKAADYLDSAADYIDSGEMDEACWSGYKQEGLKKKGKRMVPNCVPTNEAKTLGFEIKKSSGAGALTPDAAKQLGDKAVSLQKKKAAAVSLPKLKENRGIVEDILNDIQEASKSGDASLHDWFAKSKSSDGKPGWVQLGGKYAGKPCAKQPGQTTKPKCGSSKMAAEMSPEEEERAAERKRREDPNPDRKGKAINVATEEYVEEDACKTKVKSRYKVWPSAYASGALVKCRKVGAANWGNSSKNEEIVYEGDYWHPDPEIDRKLGGPGPNQRAREDNPQPKSDPKKLRPGESYMDWNKRQRGLKNSYEPDSELIDESTRLQAETGNILAVILNWRGKTYSIRMFFPQIGMPSRKDVTTEIQKIYPGSQVLQYKISTIEPGMPLIQVVNSKSKNYLLNSKTIGEEVEIEEDWQKENRKDKTDGLSQKAVNAYRRENPGSNLQTAVTEKKPTGKRASRRKNFCSRMSGMKSKLTSAKTARDPDSKINKALRRWNCN